GYELPTNKATSLGSPNNTTYPTTLAVSDAISAASHNPVTLTGQNYLSLSEQQITANPISLSGSNVTDILPVGKGGTGATSLTGYIKGNGASAFTASATIPYSDISGAPAIPTNYVITNTTQTGLSGNKTWDGVHTFNTGNIVLDGGTTPNFVLQKWMTGSSYGDLAESTLANTMG